MAFICRIYGLLCRGYQGYKLCKYYVSSVLSVCCTLYVQCTLEYVFYVACPKKSIAICIEQNRALQNSTALYITLCKLCIYIQTPMGYIQHRKTAVKYTSTFMPRKYNIVRQAIGLFHFPNVSAPHFTHTTNETVN